MFFSTIEKFDIICFLPIEVLGWLDFSITNYSLYLSFAFILIWVWFFWSLWNTVLPGLNFLVSFSLLNFVFDMVVKQIGYKGFIYYPFFLGLFLFILFSNILGLVPFSFSPTAHIVLTFFFSIVVWVLALSLGFIENGLSFYTFFVPDVPKALIPVLVIIELFSYGMRIFSLAIRLAANITAGHVLLFTIGGFSVKLMEYNLFVFLITLIALCLIILLELGVSALQAYVFVVLACIYFNDSLNLS